MILDISNKKRLGKELSYQELDYFFNNYLDGNIADYQMSSLLMAICINGMTEEETFALTKIFVDSGDVLDFSKIEEYINKNIFFFLFFNAYGQNILENNENN